MGSRAARIADREAAVKFLCKDFWIAAFGKPVDKLQTNNQVRRAAADSRRAGAQPR